MNETIVSQENNLQEGIKSPCFYEDHFRVVNVDLAEVRSFGQK